MRAAKDWLRRNPEAAFIMALGAVLRLAWLGRPSLWSDEAFTVIIARQPAADIPGLVRSLETTPALHFLLIHLWLPLWNDPLSGVRSFSALCAIAALPFYWAICRRLVPKQSTLAFLLGAASSLWIQGAQTGRCYALMLLLASAQTLLALRRSGSLKEGALYAILAACGLYAHYFYGFLLLALFIARFERRRAGLWTALHAAVAVCFVPGLVLALAQRRMALGIWFQNEPFNSITLFRVVGSFLFEPAYLALALPGAKTAAGLAASALLASVFLKKKLPDEIRFCLKLLAIPLCAAGLVGLINGKPAFQARYLAYLGLPLYPLLAWAAEEALGSWGRATRLALASIFCLGTCAYFASNLTFDPRLDALSEFVRRAAPSDEPVVHWGALEYAALRCCYLPERRHLLVDLTPGDSRYARLPGYDGLIAPDALAGMGKIIVFDPERRDFPHRVGASTGPELLSLVRARR